MNAELRDGSEVQIVGPDDMGQSFSCESLGLIYATGVNRKKYRVLLRSNTVRWFPESSLEPVLRDPSKTPEVCPPVGEGWCVVDGSEPHGEDEEFYCNQVCGWTRAEIWKVVHGNARVPRFWYRRPIDQPENAKKPAPKPEIEWHADAPPTVQQVGDRQMCQVTTRAGVWAAYSGHVVRACWNGADDNDVIAWAYAMDPHKPLRQANAGPPEPPPGYRMLARNEPVLGGDRVYDALRDRWPRSTGDAGFEQEEGHYYCREVESVKRRFKPSDVVRVLSDSHENGKVGRVFAEVEHGCKVTFGETLMGLPVVTFYPSAYVEPWTPEPGEMVRIVGPSMTGGIARMGDIVVVADPANDGDSRYGIYVYPTKESGNVYPISSLEPVE